MIWGRASVGFLPARAESVGEGRGYHGDLGSRQPRFPSRESVGETAESRAEAWLASPDLRIAERGVRARCGTAEQCTIRGCGRLH
jgi:hypothetical protein